MIYTYKDLIAEFPIKDDESIYDYQQRMPKSLLDKYEIKCAEKVLRDSLRRALNARSVRVKSNETLLNGVVTSEKFKFIEDVEKEDLSEYNATKLTTNP